MLSLNQYHACNCPGNVECSADKARIGYTSLLRMSIIIEQEQALGLSEKIKINNQHTLFTVGMGKQPKNEQELGRIVLSRYVHERITMSNF